MKLRYHTSHVSREGALKEKRQPWTTIWTFFAIAAVGCIVVGCRHSAELDRPVTGPLSLVDAKKTHPTQLAHLAPAPQDYDAEVPRDARVVAYRSGSNMLPAWLGIPATGGLHPAVLFSHGGFSLGAGDFDDIRPFINAGYIVMMPTYRGENGNSGHFERYFGEVDDALAALNYLQTVPGVDRNRLFVMGHSVGATTAMLVAESTTSLRGAAACGAFPNLSEAASAVSEFPETEFPFDPHNRYETDLRSPGLFLKDLSCPLSIYNSSSDSLYVSQAVEMEAVAKTLGKRLTNETFQGTDHYGALAPAIEKAIVAFNSE